MIAIAATGLTLVQLLLTINQSGSATQAADLSSKILEQTRAAVSEVQDLKNKVVEIEASATEAKHRSQEAFLNVKAIAARMEELGTQRKKEIEEAKATLDRVRKEFEELNAKISSVSPTVDVTVPVVRAIQSCSDGPFGIRLCVPEVRTENQVIHQENPEYVLLRSQFEALSKQLQEAEARYELLLDDPKEP